jgi:hypothetical protein
LHNADIRGLLPGFGREGGGQKEGEISTASSLQNSNLLVVGKELNGVIQRHCDPNFEVAM